MQTIADSTQQRKKKIQEVLHSLDTNSTCDVCKRRIELSQKFVECPFECGLRAHLCCLGRYFTANEDTLIPTTGLCLKCGKEVRWGDIVKKYKEKNKT